MISKTDLAYAAGIIDGEGYIALKGRTQSNRRQHQFYIVVSTADLVIAPWLYDRFGGSLYIRDKSKLSVIASDIVEWRIFGHQAVAFLKKIEPYVKLKRAQMHIGIQFGKTLQPKGGNKTNIIPPDMVAFRENLYTEMKRLNQTGKLRLTA